MHNSRQRHASIVAQRATVAFVTLFLLALLSPDISWAVNKTWTNQVDSTVNNNNGWASTGSPVSGDNVYFTNSFGGTVNITNTVNNSFNALFSGFLAGTSEQLIITNSTLT